MFSCQVSSDKYFLSQFLCFSFATLLNVCDGDDVKTFPIFAKVHRMDCPNDDVKLFVGVCLQKLGCPS